MEFAIEKSVETRCVEENKIKVKDAVIVVTGTKNKPYFSIRYTKVGEDTTYQGFGSYFLNFVFDWLRDDFEIESDETNE